MAEVLIRHGAARYRVPHGKGYVIRTAFRGMKVDVPQSEADRLIREGAAVPPDEELAKNGRMLPLPNTASDQELIAWVSVASKAEIEAEIEAHPHLADRLLTAADAVKKRLEEQNEILGGLQDTVDAGLDAAAKREQAEATASAGSADDGAVPVPPAPGAVPPATDGSVSPESGGTPAAPSVSGTEVTHDLGEVVKGSIKKVSQFLSENPDKASAVLEAEKVRAAQPDADPDHVREGLIKAVRTAAAHAAH